MSKVPVKDNFGLARDSHSKAIISVDNSAYAKAKQRKQMKRKINNQSGEIDSMKREIAELKAMVKALLNK